MNITRNDHALSACPVCGSAHAEQFATEFVVVRKCAKPICGHLYAVEVMPAAGVHEHDEDNIVWYASRNQQLIGKLLADGHVKEHGRVLDIGSGLGHIMAELKRQAPSVEVVCVEAAPKSVAYLKKYGFSVIEDMTSLDPAECGCFDAIFMVEVIEHLDDPLALLSVCRKLLNPGGFVFLTTPCGELRNGSHATAAYQIREHIQFFTERSLRLVVTKAGFQSIEFKELREYHVGSNNPLAKLVKDTARILRNKLQGRHHLIAFIK
ncbi:MAG: class I SAM-dependent methyltransferase [Methylovulum sp.]|nr:class I SAM-dependent methyltransferase [Methylovulum sp.]